MAVPRPGCTPASKNVASAALAEQFGLHRGPEFRGMSLPVQDDSFQPQPKPLHLLGGEEAAEYLLPLQEKTGGFLSINHTFYQLNRPTCFGFCGGGLGLWRRGGQRPCLRGALSAAKGAVHRGPCRPRQSQKGERTLLCPQPCGDDRSRKADRPFPKIRTIRSRNSIRRTASPSTRRTTWCMSGKRQKGAYDRYGRNDDGAGLQRGGGSSPCRSVKRQNSSSPATPLSG